MTLSENNGCCDRDDADAAAILQWRSRLDLKPGDRFVIRSSAVLSADVHGRIQEVWARFWDDEPRVPPLLILDGGLSLDVIGPCETDGPAGGGSDL